MYFMLLTSSRKGIRDIPFQGVFLGEGGKTY